MEREESKNLNFVFNLDNIDINIPIDEPIFPLSTISLLLDIEYHKLHEILQAGLIRPKLIGKRKKLFSLKDIKCIKYIQYLMEEEGVNIQGIKVILKLQNKE